MTYLAGKITCLVGLAKEDQNIGDSALTWKAVVRVDLGGLRF